LTNERTAVTVTRVPTKEIVPSTAPAEDIRGEWALTA
jgi:hypothetical protein